LGLTTNEATDFHQNDGYTRRICCQSDINVTALY
jgi:hypothetical protein